MNRRRRQQPHQQAQQRCGKHSEFFGAVLRNAFGRDLAENEDHNGDDYRGKRRADVAVKPNEQHRADGRGGDVDDVVADEDGRKQLVIAFRQPAGKHGALATLLGHCFQPCSVQRGKGRFRR